MLLSTTALTPPAHAKAYAPSAAARWTACPASAWACQLYDREDSVHSIKGDVAHSHLEVGIVFGIEPDTADPDMDMNIRDVLEWVQARKVEYGSECKLYAEQRYDIVETGEFGTCDITFVAPTVIHIADYKNGYVLVEVVINGVLNEQMMTYLLGAIAKHGPRPLYRITVIQPNYFHRDGMIRTVEVTHEQVEEFRRKVLHAVESDYFYAGKHCKKSYCEHRGNCATFLEWAQENAADAWHPSEVNAISDEQLAAALDHSDVLHGIRDELRKAAMYRMLQMDRKIRGYKVVKSRIQREFAGEAGREACYLALLQLGYSADDLYEKKPFNVGALTLYEQAPLTVAGVERMVKQTCKRFKRGVWQGVWDEHFRPHIREFSGSLTLERETDGRPAHTRGSEFGSLVPAQSALVKQVV